MSRYDLGRGDLSAILEGEPSYRVDQLWDGLHRGLSSPGELTCLPASLRSRLEATAELAPALTVARRVTADDGETEKWLYRLAGEAVVETVLMHYPERSTVCVSSQAGCAMGCTFCATGQEGYGRQLTTGEILEQVVRAARTSRERGRRLDNVVFMGMGEPLANYARVWAAVERIVGDLGIGARRVTISTVGIVPGIRRLARAGLQVNLAVSLHAANDRLRDELVPVNKRYPIGALVEACRDYGEETNRRISFEWALIDTVNDRASDAGELAELAGPLKAHVNLIPLNPTPGYPVRGTPAKRVRAFRDELGERGVNATIRATRGREIGAACGQLAGAVTVLPHPREPVSREPVRERSASGEELAARGSTSGRVRSTGRGDR